MKKPTLKHFLRWILYVLLLLFLGTFLLIEGLIFHYARKTEYPGADLLLVLGARLYGDIPSPALKERLDKAAECYFQNPQTLLIVSGGKGEGETLSEAEGMKRYLVSLGIPEERILQEETSTNTFENIRFSRELLEKTHPELNLKALNIGIVTNGFHVFRGVLLAKDAGLNPVGIAAKTPPTTLVKGYLREYFGVLKYLIVDRHR